MISEITTHKLKPDETELIRTVANWYFDEWESPVDHTVSRLQKQEPEDMLCHYILMYNDTPIASGGIFFNVNLFKVYPDMKKYTPMIGMVFTIETFRRQGLAAKILQKLEEEARKAGYEELFLYTATAESLYTKCGWSTFLHLKYKGLDTVVMKKKIQ